MLQLSYLMLFLRQKSLAGYNQHPSQQPTHRWGRKPCLHQNHVLYQFFVCSFIRDRKMSKSDYYVTLCNIFVFILWHVFDNSTFFLLAKTRLKNQKHCCKFAQCRQRQKNIVRNQLVYSICLKHIPSLVTKCWCLCQSHKEVIESNMQVTFRITLHI